jgi:predicted dehydrogenase
MSANSFTRRRFLETTGAALGGSFIALPALAHPGAPDPSSQFRTSRQNGKVDAKTRVALVGLGNRGVRWYGRFLVQNYSEHIEMVGICDLNPGRLEWAHGFIGADCPIFTNLDEMLEKTRPDRLVVTTWDWEHHNCIVAGLEHGVDIVCEKPLTIDAEKCQIIIDAEKKYSNKIYVTFNYRYPVPRARLKQMLLSGIIGEIRSVDFHWNITHQHQTRYMQRWHGDSRNSGTLWVHKATHHFDMINWFLDSEPELVYAQDSLDIFGSNGSFRSTNCRRCPHTSNCKYYWDINANDFNRNLYANHEHHDGYIRDNCVFRHNIDSPDKHACLVTYANKTLLNYSLTSDTDHEGFWLAFNGTKGRIEGREGGYPSWIGRPMEWLITPLNGKPEVVRVDFTEGGHWGGDEIMFEQLFSRDTQPDPLGQMAGVRDGVMSVLAGVAARQSALTGQPVRIADLTSLVPQAKRPPVNY